MLPLLWHKQVLVSIEMDPADVAYEAPPLPLITSFSMIHYIGFYSDLIHDFFYRYLPHPINPNQFWLQLLPPSNSPPEDFPDEAAVQIKPTDLVFNMFSRHLLQHNQLNPAQQNKPPIIYMIAHFRSEPQSIAPEVMPLFGVFKQNLKASLAIKNKNQGIAKLMTTFKQSQLVKMFEDFRALNYEEFYGESEEDSQNIGYTYLMKEENGWFRDGVPVRFMIQGSAKVQRSISFKTDLGEYLNQLLGRPECKYKVYLYGVQIECNVQVRELVRYSHPDGYLYLTVHIIGN